MKKFFCRLVQIPTPQKKMTQRPFPMVNARIEKSPFRTKENVQKYLRLHKSGHAIGFTYIASLKSMGLLPRTDGAFRLGKKYLL